MSADKEVRQNCQARTASGAVLSESLASEKKSSGWYALESKLIFLDRRVDFSL